MLQHCKIVFTVSSLNHHHQWFPEGPDCNGIARVLDAEGPEFWSWYLQLKVLWRKGAVQDLSLRSWELLLVNIDYKDQDRLSGSQIHV